MSAVDGEDLKSFTLDSADPARNICRHAVPGPGVRVAISREPCLTFRKCFQRTQRDPRLIRPAPTKAGKDKSDHGNADKRRSHHVECCPKLQQETAARRPGT